MKTIPDGYRKDRMGRLVPISQISEIDQARDQIVEEIVGKAKALAKDIINFKRLALADVDAFVDLSAEKYDAHLGGRLGNVTLTSYDGRFKIIRAVAHRISFDENLHAAKALIDKCLAKWSEGSRDEIKTIVQDAFQVDKVGSINTHRILSLRKLDIQDETWQKAMEAIANAIRVDNSCVNVRFYELDESGKYQQITLDPTSL